LGQAINHPRTSRAKIASESNHHGLARPPGAWFWEKYQQLVYSNAFAINALSSFVASSSTRVGIKNRRIATRSPLPGKILRAGGAAPCLSQARSLVFGTARSRGIRPARPRVPTTSRRSALLVRLRRDGDPR
jgi:hypothetical protein